MNVSFNFSKGRIKLVQGLSIDDYCSVCLTDVEQLNVEAIYLVER